MRTTVFDIAAGLYQVDPDTGRVSPRPHERVTVTDGIEPAPTPDREGLYKLTPEQAASVVVDALEVGEEIAGYQRRFNAYHARRIAERLIEGFPMPPVVLGLNGTGELHATDGQHRLVASIIARTPIWATVMRMGEGDQRRMFASQNRSSRVNPSTTTLTGDGPIDRYVQEACIAHAKGEQHAWADLVSAMSSDVNYLSASQVAGAIRKYLLGQAGMGNVNSPTRSRTDFAVEASWSPEIADELGGIVRAIGTRRTNPSAFIGRNFNALVACAVLAVRRSDRHDADLARWHEVMPRFSWLDYQHLHKSEHMRSALIAHWNKRLPAARRVEFDAF